VSVFQLAVGAVVLAATVLIAAVTIDGMRSRRSAFEVIDGARKSARYIGLGSTPTARYYLLQWKAFALDHGATPEQAEAVAAEVMRRWRTQPIAVYARGEGPEADVLRLLEHEEEPLEGEHEPGRDGDGRQGQ
jgi:hypothetical protein